MFNKDKYHKLIEFAKIKGEFNGKTVKGKGEVYSELAEEIGLSVDSVIGYGRKKSNVRVPEDTVRRIEELFGLKKGELDTEYIDFDENKKEEKTNMTDFNKGAIFHVYSLLKDYLHSDDVQCEEAYCELITEIDKYKITMPSEVFDKIYAFVEDCIEPIVYKPQEVFRECYTEEIGNLDENRVFRVHNIEGTEKMIINYMFKLVEIEQELDEFATSELFPYLV